MSFICNSIFFIFYFLLLPWWFLFFSITFLHYSDISEKADLSMADLKYVLSSGVKKKKPKSRVSEKMTMILSRQCWQLPLLCTLTQLTAITLLQKTEKQNYTVQHNCSLLLSRFFWQIWDLENYGSFKGYCSTICLPVLIISKEEDSTTYIIQLGIYNNTYIILL